MAYANLSKRALAILTLERLDIMAANLTALQTAVTNLTTTVNAMKPVLDSAQELATRAIATLVDLVARIAALEPDAAAIAALAESVGSTVSSLQVEQAEQTERNAALQAQLDAIPPPPTT